MNTQEKLSRIIENRKLFESVSDGFKNKLAQAGQIKTLQKGQMLFVHQDEADKFYIVSQGWMKLFRETLDGDQVVIDILPQGHVFGETSIFEDDIYPYSAEAAETGEVIALPLELLKAEIQDNPKLALSMLSAMARYRKQQDQELEHRTIQNAPQRIGCFLLKIADQRQSGPVKIQLPYDKTLVASRLGMQPETFSRALSKLKGATGIEIKGATIEMKSLDQLAQFSCIACSSEFPCKDTETQA